MDSSRESSEISFLSRSDCYTGPLSVLSRDIKQSRRVFIGTYLERRYVQRLQAYRDVIVIDSNEEELIKCLEEIKTFAHRQFGTRKWLGITCDMKDSEIQNYNLWVELEGIPLGRHWFQMRSIKIKGQAIQLSLKYLRMFQANELKSLTPNEFPVMNYRELFTYDNICGTTKFLAVFVMSLLTVACNALWYLGDYSIKLTHELSGVIHALTPIIFGIIDFFTKCVGGLYWLLYMVWRGNSIPTYQIRSPIQPYTRGSKNSNRRAILYSN